MTQSAAAPHGVHLAPCDIAPYRAGNTGVDHVTTFDSGRPGAHLAIVALTHGNEVCGAHALRFLFENDARPTRGKLTLCFANVAAYETFDAARPFHSRFVEEDFNRLWDEATLDGERRSVELARAREIRPVIDAADHLLDIHSVDLPQAPMLLAGVRAKGRALAATLGAPRHVVIDAGHAAGRRLRDYVRFDDPATRRSSCLVECGYHFHEDSARVAIETSLRFLRAFDAIDPAFLAERLGEPEDEEQIVVEVSHAIAAETDDFVFARAFEGFEVVPEKGAPIGTDGGREIRTPYPDCVMVMPAREPAKGRTAVRLGRVLSPRRPIQPPPLR